MNRMHCFVVAWHPLQKHGCFFDLQYWHETLRRHKFIFKSGVHLTEREKIISNICISISQTPLWVSAFGPYLGCQLPALGLLAEAVQWGEVAVIYQGWTDSYWHKDSEEELRVLQVPPDLYRALQQKQQILDLAPQQRMFLSKTICKQLKDAAPLQRNQDLIFAVPYS